MQSHTFEKSFHSKKTRWTVNPFEQMSLWSPNKTDLQIVLQNTFRTSLYSKGLDITSMMLRWTWRLLKLLWKNSMIWDLRCIRNDVVEWGSVLLTLLNCKRVIRNIEGSIHNNEGIHYVDVIWKYKCFIVWWYFDLSGEWRYDKWWWRSEVIGGKVRANDTK